VSHQHPARGDFFISPWLGYTPPSFKHKFGCSCEDVYLFYIHQFLLIQNKRALGIISFFSFRAVTLFICCSKLNLRWNPGWAFVLRNDSCCKDILLMLSY
jgi:hypothetical protein